MTLIKLKAVIEKILKVITHPSGDATITISANGSGSIHLVKYGRLVLLSGIVHNNVSGINLLMVGLPQAYIPAWDTWISCNIYGATSGAEAHIAAANGGLYLSYPVAGSDIKVSGSWLAASTAI